MLLSFATVFYMAVPVTSKLEKQYFDYNRGLDGLIKVEKTFGSHAIK